MAGPSNARDARQPPHVDEGERRTVTVLFADLSGFTSYSESVDPEAVRAVAEEAANRLGEIVVKHGGTVDKIIGDCVMAVYGAPAAHEDDPERAVRSALAMHEYVGAHREDFAGMQLTIGVQTGEVIYAPVGPQGEFTVLGDAVNTAARLQSAASRGEVLIGEPTARAVAGAIELDEIEPINAKGKTEPVLAWRARAVKGERARKAAAPFVGRRVESARLNEVWDRARTLRTPHLAATLGSAGIGKTRLIDAFAARLDPGVRVFRGACLSYGEGITYWPIVEMIKGAAGILHDDSIEITSSKLGALLESLGIDDLDQLRSIAVAMANLVAVPRTPRGTYSAQEITRAELHWGVRRLFELIAERSGAVMILDDLHHAEPTLLELLEFVLAGTAPILIVAGARSELKEAAPALLDPKPNRRTIELAPLDEAESRELLVSLAGDGAPVDAALEASGGNPLYLQEIVGMLADPSAAGAVPATLQALIDARIDRLPEAARRLAGRAAVIGRVFWSGALAHVDEEPADAALRELEQQEIVVRAASSSIAGEEEFAFKHSLLREIAYARVPKAQRAVAHRRCADWIGGLRQADQWVEVVAHHLEQSCLLGRDAASAIGDLPVTAAVVALREAAAKATRRGGARESDRYFARALELIGEDHPETAVELRFQRAGTLMILGDLPGAREAYVAVEDAARSFGRADLVCDALVELATIETSMGRFADARARSIEARDLADDLDLDHIRIKLAFASALMHSYSGASAEAIEELREAAGMARDAGDVKQEQRAWMQLATELLNAGRLADAQPAFERALELARDLNTLMLEAMCTFFLGYLKWYRGPRDEALALCTRALAWFERTPHAQSQAQTLTTLARLALWAGDAPKAERWLREALQLARKGGGSMVVDFYGLLVPTLLRQGRLEDAARAAREARKAAPAEDPYAVGQACLADALVAAAEGRIEQARELFDQALAGIEPMGLLVDLAEARLAFGRALAQHGDERGAREQFGLAGEALDGTGADALAADVERELESLTGAADRSAASGQA